MDTVRSMLSMSGYRVYLAGLFLLPIGFWASTSVPFNSLKMLIAAFAVGIALLLAVGAALRKGQLTFQFSWVAMSLWLLPVVYIVAAVFSPSWSLSFIGTQLDSDTVFFMVLLALVVSVPLYLFESRADVVRAFFVVLVSAWLVALFQLARLFLGPTTFEFGVFAGPLFSLVGKWNDLSIFFGFVGVLSLITLEALPLKPNHRYIVWATLVVSLFFMALVNFMPVWVCSAILALGVVLYRAVVAPNGKGRFSLAATIVLLISIICIIFAPSLGSVLGAHFGTTQIEARPSLASTISVATEVLKHSPIVGSGPNTFLLMWDAYRPKELNQSIFWNADFTSGVGFVPTTLITAGILGFLAWIVFGIMYLIAGIRSLILSPVADQYAYYLLLASYTAGFYILAMAVVYIPSPVLLILGFAAIGMFVALDHHERHGKSFQLVFADRPRMGFIAVLVLVLLGIAALVALYEVGAVFAANVYYERASQVAQNSSDFATAEADLATASSLSTQDRFNRLGVLIHLAELNQIATGATQGTQDDLQKKFQTALGGAVEQGLSAVRQNGTDYRNWQALASAYHSVVSLNITGAYDSAVTAYTRAATLNPITPTLPLARAQLEIARGDANAARPFIDQALGLKEDYIPALLLLAQIELTAGNLTEAIKRAEAASVFEPSNPVTHFQVGVLKFQNKDISGAQKAFSDAVSIAPDYANAHYYLGRVYLEQGKRADALAEFEAVLKLNPDNADVKQIIATINTGGDPFAPPAPAKPAKK